MLIWCTPRCVPLGTVCPETVAHSVVVRRRMEGTGGYIRKPSSRHAKVYGSLAEAEEKVMSSSLSKADLTSATAFRMASGVRNIQYVTPARSVAVVSEPAKNRMCALPASSASEIFSFESLYFSKDSMKSPRPFFDVSSLRFIAASRPILNRPSLLFWTRPPMKRPTILQREG